MKEIIVAGHSHSVALGLSPSGPGTPITLRPLTNGDARFVGLGGPIPRDEQYWSALVGASNDRTVAIAWEGNQHNALFLFEYDPPFDFVFSGNPDLPVDTSRVLASEMMIRERFAPSLKGLRDLLSALASVPGCKPIVVATTPPLESQIEIRQRLIQDVYFTRLASEKGVDLREVPISAPMLRLKLWALLQSQMSELAGYFGIAYCGIPKDALTDAGFFRPEMADDLTHGNADYGLLMLEKIARFGGR